MRRRAVRSFCPCLAGHLPAVCWLALLCLAGASLGRGASPHATIVGRVLDAESGQVIPCTVIIRNRDQSVDVDDSDFSGRFYSTGQFEKEVAAGATTMAVGRGFDYVAERRQLDLHAGERVQLTFRLAHQANLRRLGWYCGDNHVHMFHGPVQGESSVDFPFVARVARAVGLDYLSIAQHWNVPPSETTPARLGELCKAASTGDFILTWNMEGPKNYWRGDVTHCAGHCWFVGMRGDTPEGHNVIEELTQMSAHDYESEKAPTPNFESHALIHALGGTIAYTHPCRWGWGRWGGEGIYPAEEGKFVSNLAQELPYDTVVGPTYDTLDILMQSWDRNNYPDAQRLWFMLLNKGYRIAGTASTDASFDRGEDAVPGIVRVYTREDGPPSIAAVAHAMKAGQKLRDQRPAAFAQDWRAFSWGCNPH